MILLWFCISSGWYIPCRTKEGTKLRARHSWSCSCSWSTPVPLLSFKLDSTSFRMSGTGVSGGQCVVNWWRLLTLVLLVVTYQQHTHSLCSYTLFMFKVSHPLYLSFPSTISPIWYLSMFRFIDSGKDSGWERTNRVSDYAYCTPHVPSLRYLSDCMLRILTSCCKDCCELEHSP